ncbi:Zinc-exporting ATPase [Bertholletia excelsa]
MVSPGPGGLVSACPCALILSTPVATFAALSKAATSGLLIKGGEYLETLSQIKTIAFDKTGTITRGEFIISDFRSLSDGLCLNTLLFWVSSIESKSSHPMAAALVDYGRSQSVEPKPEEVKEFENFPGEGIHGKIDGQNVYVGNRKMAARAGCPVVPSLEGNKEGKSIGYIFLGDTPAGIFSLSDACRTGAGEAITELKSMGIKTAMLTGDSHQAATLVQNQLGGALDEVHSELLPQDKARIIKDFQKQAPTAMVGDGLNDTLALATADIGISMGISGSALAAETGHVILMSNDIRKIPKIINLARKARRKVIENVILSILTKAAIIALAIAGHPLVWAAVLADVGTCLVVILNSMLLLRREEKNFPKTCFQKYGNGHNNCHSSHSHPHGCSDGEAKATKRPQKCCSRRFAPSCGPEPKPKPLSKTCSEKHGKGHNSCHSSHSHQHGCSDSKAKTTKKPQKCCSRRCAPTCGPDPPSSSPCEKIKSSKCCGHEDQVIQEEKHLDHHECCELVARGIELREGSHKHSCSGSCEEEKCKEMADMHEIFPASYEKCTRTKMASQDVQGLNLAPKGECYLNIPCKHNHSSDEEEQVNCFTEEASIHNGVNLPSTSKVSLGIDDHHLRCEVAKACSNRQIGGCCKSFREECCTKCGHLGANFGGGLTEIVIDLASK